MRKRPSGIMYTIICSSLSVRKEINQLLENLSAELSRRDNRQGLYSRAVLADEVLKDHFFQGLLQPDAAQELPEATLAAGVELGGRLHAVALASLMQRPDELETRGSGSHRAARPHSCVCSATSISCSSSAAMKRRNL